MIERNVALLALGALMIAGPVFGDTHCMYKGATYSHGSAACQSGTQYRCDDGVWKGLSIACAEDPSVALKACEWKGASYYPGSASCQSNTQYRCEDGAWTGLGISCVLAPGVAANRVPAGSTCMFDGATVATASTICKTGITFRCDEGEWRNLGTACQ